MARDHTTRKMATSRKTTHTKAKVTSPRKERKHLQLLIADQHFTHFSQPIVELKGRLCIGQEYLLRGPLDSPYFSPDVFFNKAWQYHLENELDLASLYAVMSQAGRKERQVFVNVLPSTLLAKETLAILEEYQKKFEIKAGKVTMEIVETEAIENLTEFVQILTRLREMGFLIALDDVGTGHASLQSLLELEPEYIKIPHLFISGIDHSLSRQRMVQALVDYSRGHIVVVAEGIETEMELVTLQQIGVDCGQGFLLGKPVPTEEEQPLQ